MKCSNEPLSGNCFESVKVRTKRAKRVRLYKMKIKKKRKNSAKNGEFERRKGKRIRDNGKFHSQREEGASRLSI